MASTLPSHIRAFIEQGFRLETTHIDYVLIGPKFTYKIKKTVKLPFVDYSSLQKRKFYCQKELELNQRYSPEMYLGIEPIFFKGKLVDHAVKMLTMAQNKRLDLLLDKNNVSKVMIKRLAQEIACFHKKAKIIAVKNKTQKLIKTIDLNFITVRQFASKETASTLYNYLIGFIRQNSELIASRTIKDLHGDLHAENIFYDKKPYLFDCVEFEPAFRQIDTAAEIAFLLMDLEFRGKNNLANLLLKEYLQTNPDKNISKLLRFYKCHYASVRGFVCGLSNDLKTARKYFDLALKYAQPQIYIIGGSIGTGKTTLAKKIQKQTKYQLIQSDVVRKKLAKVPLNKKADQRYYSQAFSLKTYQTMLIIAKSFLDKGQGVVLDATFSKQAYRNLLMKLITVNAYNFQYIETCAPEKIVVKRLMNRKHSVSDAGPDLVKNFNKAYEPPIEIPNIVKFSPL